jgi:hypothetical protein
VASSKAKSLHVARLSIEEFFRKHRDVYFLTFTEPGRKADQSYWTKDEAEAAFKPFRDLCSRRGCELLVVWEIQKRGSWHPHCLVNQRFDVVQMRSWMVARGWGPQMRFVWVTRPHSGVSQMPELPEVGRITRYLTKYLTKSAYSVSDSTKKKVFGGSKSSRAGDTGFKWCPWVKAGSFLWQAGRGLFVQLNGRQPKFRDVREVIRLGVEETDWADYDPLWEFGFP